MSTTPTTARSRHAVMADCFVHSSRILLKVGTPWRAGQPHGTERPRRRLRRAAARTLPKNAPHERSDRQARWPIRAESVIGSPRAVMVSERNGSTSVRWTAQRVGPRSPRHARRKALCLCVSGPSCEPSALFPALAVTSDNQDESGHRRRGMDHRHDVPRAPWTC